MTDEEAALILETRVCRSDGSKCECPPLACRAFDRVGDTAYWSGIAAAIGAPLPALAALAKDEAVVVPRALTAEMAEGLYNTDQAEAPWASEVWQPVWDAALDASPFKREAE